MDTFESDATTGRRLRRRHSAQFKQSTVAQCMSPGVSIAAVALHHGLNAGLLRKWVIEAERQSRANLVASPTAPAARDGSVAPGMASFVPLTMPAPKPEHAIHIELQRAGATVSIRWPAGAARECAAWLREWLG